MRISFFVFLFCLQSNLLFAQFNFEYSTEINVSKNGNLLRNAWAGGVNYAQPSEIDFDFDGDMDLFVFDRENNNVLLYRNDLVGITREYHFVYNGRSLFPDDMRYRVFLADYNQDGKNDIFTYGIGGIKVYKNIGNSSLGLQWELASNLLYSQFPFSLENLYVSSADIPAIYDIDSDGDLDILTFSLGGSHLEYHKNMSQETYGHSDSLHFVLMNQCWGKFAEDPTNSSVLLNDTNPPCNGSVIVDPEKPGVNPKMHAGSSLLALDFDDNGVADLVVGDVSSPALIKLVNGGTAPNTDSPMTFMESNFPSNTVPVNLQIFPAAFYLDADFDGVKDLLVGPNAKNASENEKSLLFYKNTGQNNLPNFIFQQNNFLQDEMIDHGTGSFPLFFDQNNDGKKDLVVGNFYRYKPILDKESSVALYRNTSVGTTTEFTFIDGDYLNLSSQNFGLRTVPTFGDMDADGDDDMIIARENGNLMYYKNNGATGNAVFATPIQPILSNLGNAINEESFSFPQIFDLDKDGLLDLIIGKRNGKLVFYKNIGTASTPSFQKVNDHLGNVDVSNASSPDGYAAPHFFRYQDTTYLFLGAIDGKLHFYKNIDGKLSTDSSFSLHSDNFLNLDCKGYSSFSVNDIDDDGFLNLFVGTDLGGIIHLEVDPNSSSSLEEKTKNELLIYPNPTNGIFTIHENSSEIKLIKLYDALGKEVAFTMAEVNNQKQIQLLDEISGIIIVHVTFEDNSIGQKRMVVLN